MKQENKALLKFGAVVGGVSLASMAAAKGAEALSKKVNNVYFDGVMLVGSLVAAYIIPRTMIKNTMSRLDQLDEVKIVEE